MKTVKTYIFAVPALLLAGCAAVSTEQLAQLDSLVAQGRCTEAEAIAGSTNDPVRFNNLGVVAHNCERNLAKARNLYEYGARHGEQSAINNLLRNGWPVPPADIKQNRDAASASQAASGLMLLQAAQPKTAPAQPTSGFIKNNTGSYMNGGDRYCRYSDGTVINVGLNFCPFTLN